MAALAAQACAAPAWAADRFRLGGQYAKPIGGAPATENPTPYSAALRCLGASAGQGQKPRLAVSAIADMTGKRDLTTGAKLTQGADLFVLTALGRAGLPLVERGDRVISDAERAYASAHMLSDDPAAPADPQRFRAIMAGEVAGSDYYVSGGLTELNYNIRSSGGDVAIGATRAEGLKASASHATYVITVAVDLRLVRTRSQEIVGIASYRKEIVGREIKPGIFDFFNGTVVDISGGKSALEPVQLAVRTLIERAVYDFAATLYGRPANACLAEAPAPAQATPAARAELVVAAAPRPAVSAPVTYGGRYLDRRTWRPLDDANEAAPSPSETIGAP
ncbi:holdfast anchoring protein HfaB [uncultured Caulobacter sp.]|uniref:holdfast anchoring protein HfaB n=1 Tax=uncultured Caulobacter sp. TaxID=158749 RepID=UPI002616EE51|nr:holdfast anchoring protein HfaB [uncultured Caulobacter sp.]